jgi:hypothetical protein
MATAARLGDLGRVWEGAFEALDLSLARMRWYLGWDGSEDLDAITGHCISGMLDFQLQCWNSRLD